MALSPDGQLLASVDGAGRLSVWEVPSGRLRHSWDLQQQPRPTEPHDTMTATQQRRGKGKVYLCGAEGELQNTVRESVGGHQSWHSLGRVTMRERAPTKANHVMVM